VNNFFERGKKIHVSSITMRVADERVTIIGVLDGWQQGCWNMAKTGKPFAVEGIDPQTHQAFCTAICDAYRYRTVAAGHRVMFNPQSGNRPG
jgi:hypothetical protein